jgi:hypothetical protein
MKASYWVAVLIVGIIAIGLVIGSGISADPRDASQMMNIENTQSTPQASFAERGNTSRGDISSPMQPAAQGDELFRLDVTTPTGHYGIVGIEYVGGNYYITSGGELYVEDTNYLFKLDQSGNLVESWQQPTTSDWGWRDLAWDGTYLYASDSAVIDQIDPATGQKTGTTIPSPVNPARGLAYDPDTDHFWTANWDSDLYEIDRSGTVIHNYPNSWYIYGLGWDSWSEGGPYLWGWTQDGYPLASAVQFDPSTGTETGVSFQGSSINDDDSDLAGGADISPELVSGKVTLAALHQADPRTIVGYELSEIIEPFPGNQLGTCVPDTTPPFAYINQPWDFVEGAVTPDAQVNATLKRGGNQIAANSAAADSDGWFSLEFLDNGEHVDVMAYDEIELSGGGLDETLTVVDIKGWIDVEGDGVGGKASGGTFDVWGDVCVRRPSDINFISEGAYFDAEGRFDVQFDGLVDIGDDFIAQVVYPDANGNYVVQLFDPASMDMRVLISEDRVEGVAEPGAQIDIVVWNQEGQKGTAQTTADDTGFYNTGVTQDGKPVDLALGDHVGVSKPGHAREMFLQMSHKSSLRPWSDLVIGQVEGLEIPPQGAQGKVDLWSASEKQWYTQYVWIEPDGSYGADFSEMVDMSINDRIRLWVQTADGNMQASFGTTLLFGVSTSSDQVWGYGTAGSLAQISLHRGYQGDQLMEEIGGAGVWTDAMGYFTTTLTSDGQVVDIAPTNVVRVLVGEHYKTFFIGDVEVQGDSETDTLEISGPPNSVVHLEGRHPNGEDEVWIEETIGPEGMTTVSLAPFDLKEGDIFDLTCYADEIGVFLHRKLAAEGAFNGAYIPLVFRDSN